jgi:hypothetical protein
LRAGEVYEIETPAERIAIAHVGLRIAALPMDCWVEIRREELTRSEDAKLQRDRRTQHQNDRKLFTTRWNECESIQEVARCYNRPVGALVRRAYRLRGAGYDLRMMPDEHFGIQPSDN